MSTEIPPVTLQDGILCGWNEFEQWAERNHPAWHRALREARAGNCTKEQAISVVAHLLTIHCQELQKRVCDLELIAPRKMRFSDGSIRVYRAPAELLPLDPPWPKP